MAATMLKNAAVVFGIMFLLANIVLVAKAVSCNPIELSPCLPSFTSSAPPSTLCCNKLREQKPCLCQYVKNPDFARYINSENAKRVSSTCQVPFPQC